MVNYREILRLHSSGNSIRAISRTLRSSRDTVATTLAQAKAVGVHWPLGDDVSNDELKTILFPGKCDSTSPYVYPDCARIHKELARNGVTLTLLWEEYCANVRDSGGIPYMYTQFCQKYRRWARITKATMRINHKPGDAMQVDWAGDPIYISDKDTGEETAAFIFVAVLPCSWYTYAEVCSDMKTENWLLCHVHAYNYFGGMPRLLIPDNCKTATTRNTQYETVLNRSYQELAEHYSTAIVPARVRRPDDKAAAEGSVRVVSTWITAALRDRKFCSVADAQKAVLEKLDLLNHKPFKKRPGCRYSAFVEEEQAYLQNLPVHAYEPSVWLHPKVGKDYLVTDGRNKYSVPFDLIGETVNVRVTKHVVEVFFKGIRVAMHPRAEKFLQEPIIKPEHMPESHKKYLNYNADNFIELAEGIGPETLAVVRYFLTSGKEVEQGYKFCAGLAKLAEKHGKTILEAACSKVMHLTQRPTLRNISILCRSATFKKTEKAVEKSVEHEEYDITRGASYYRRGGRKND